jgi:hypothetical protein
MSNRLNKFIDRYGFHPIDLLVFLAGCLLFYLTLFNQLPLAYRNFIEFFVKENSIVLFSIFSFLVLTYLISDWPGRAIRWLGLIWLFGIFLRGYWVINRTSFFQLYGILPWVDATEYYANAQRVLQEFPMVGISAGRPIFSTFFASLLKFTHLNMVLSIGILVFLVAVSLFLFGEFIRKQYGVIPAAFATALTFMFYRNYLGGISTESLGLLIGLLGWIWLIIGVSKRSLIEICLGFFMVSIAFTIRAGPMIVLPMIVLEVVITSLGKKDKIRNFFLVSLSGITGFVINSIVLMVFSSKGIVPFVTYFYSLFGMAAGGKGWNYIFETHPEVIALLEPTKTQKIIQFTLELIQKDPLMLLKGMLDQFIWFFSISSNSVFSFLNTNTLPYNYVLQGTLYLFSLIAIINMVRYRKKNGKFLLLMILLGILFSVPIVPPQDDAYMRPYAVVIPILALIPGLGFQWLVNLLIMKFPVVAKLNGIIAKKPFKVGFNYYLCGYSFFILILVIFGPFIFFAGRKQESNPVPPCGVNQQAFSWVYYEENVMNIKKDLVSQEKNWISLSSARDLKHGPDFYALTQFFDYIKNGITISPEINRFNGEFAWVRVPTYQYEKGNGVYLGCGEMITDPASDRLSIFKVQSSIKLDNESSLPNGK